jgi:hypothetical protein
MELAYLVCGLLGLVVLFWLGNWLVGQANSLARDIPPQELETLQQIKTKLSEAAYISGDSEFATCVEMLETFLAPSYPSSGIVRPFETWMILARRHYNAMRCVPRRDSLETDEEVSKLLREIIVLTGRLQANEVIPIRGHIWLLGWLGLLQRMEI